MENQNHSTTSIAMTYGLYMGLALVLNMVIFYVMGHPFSQYMGYIVYVILIGGGVLTMRYYRDTHPDEGFTYGQALGLGTLQALFASLIFAFFTFVLFKLIDKTLIDKLLTFLEETFLKSGMNEDVTDNAMAMYRKVLTPLTYSVGQILSITLTGFIFSLIIAIFFKKQPANPFYGIE